MFCTLDYLGEGEEGGICTKKAIPVAEMNKYKTIYQRDYSPDKYVSLHEQKEIEKQAKEEEASRNLEMEREDYDVRLSESDRKMKTSKGKKGKKSKKSKTRQAGQGEMKRPGTAKPDSRMFEKPDGKNALFKAEDGKASKGKAGRREAPLRNLNIESSPVKKPKAPKKGNLKCVIKSG